jgi:hypothetical protein
MRLRLLSYYIASHFFENYQKITYGLRLLFHLIICDWKRWQMWVKVRNKKQLQFWHFEKSTSVEHQVRSRSSIVLRIRLHHNDAAPDPQHWIIYCRSVWLLNFDLRLSNTFRIRVGKKQIMRRNYMYKTEDCVGEGCKEELVLIPGEVRGYIRGSGPIQVSPK